MKDIDELLKINKPTPNRKLRTNFTQTIIERVEQPREKQSWLTRVKGVLEVKLIQKPAMFVAGIIAIAAISGTAYAAIANWPAISTIISGEKTLKSGNRVVKVVAENCEYTKALHGAPTNKTAYYEVKKDSHFTNKQVVSMIQGICEEDVMNKIVNEHITSQHKIYEGKKGVIGSRLLRVEAINSGSITLSPDPQYNKDMDTIYDKKVTYAVASDVKTFNYDSPVAPQTIKVGDTVAVVTSDSRNISTETPDYKENPATTTVDVIVEMKPLSGNPNLFYANLGSEFVRVEPAKNGDGFVRVYDFEDERK